MTAELYLIAHKVRGEPAFDVALKMFVEALNDEFWIIPTSGHRAYPYWFAPLNDVAERYDPICGFNVPEPPAELRDHYTVSARESLAIEDRGTARKGEGQYTAEQLGALLGIGRAARPKGPPLRRPA